MSLKSFAGLPFRIIIMFSTGNYVILFQNNFMDHTKDLEDLNKKSLEKIDEYLSKKENLDKEHHERLNEAKKKWQSSWSDFMDVLMYLETLEI
jgi:hypothetical protein